MAGRAYKEVIQWGYVALVCVGLTFTTIIGAAANSKPAERQIASPLKMRDACSSQMRNSENPVRQVCTLSATTHLENDLHQIINSTPVSSHPPSNPAVYPGLDSPGY